MENQIKENVSVCQCQNLGILPTTWHWEKLRTRPRRKSSKLTGGKFRIQAGCFPERCRVSGCVIEAWSASFPIVPRLRSARRRPSSFATVRLKYVSARFLPEYSVYPSPRTIQAFYPGSHCHRQQAQQAVTEFRSAAHLEPGPPIGSRRAQSHSGALECCLANGIAASV